MSYTLNIYDINELKKNGCCTFCTTPRATHEIDGELLCDNCYTRQELYDRTATKYRDEDHIDVIMSLESERDALRAEVTALRDALGNVKRIVGEISPNDKKIVIVFTVAEIGNIARDALEAKHG